MEYYERYGKFNELNKIDNVAYWQKLGKKEIFEAAWELVVDYYNYHKLDTNELRFHRTVETFGKIRG